MTDTVSITDENPDSLHAHALIGALMAELGELYGDEWKNPYASSEFSAPRSAFLVARHERVAIACAGFRPLDNVTTTELRRVYVAPTHRNRGVARSLLAMLEGRARVLGYSEIRLETGMRQPEAIRLYERAHYRRIAPYGPYVHDPLSVCFRKMLSV